MSSTIAVAIIAGVAAIVAPILSFLGGRQATADVRANINRDLDILARLNPDSDAAKALGKDIEDAIQALTRRQKWWRDRRATFGPLAPAYVLVVTGIVGVIVTGPNRAVYGNPTFWNAVQLVEVLYILVWAVRAFIKSR